MKILLVAVRLALWATVLSVPLCGIWVASSMAALLNGPRWFTVLGGALLFPILPVVWDVWAVHRAARREAAQRATSTFFSDLRSAGRVRLTLPDRLLLRTLVLNVSFLGVLVATSPKTATSALTARGDWPLDAVEGDWVPGARTGVLRLADALDRLARIETKDPYAGLGESDTPAPPTPPAPPTLPAPTTLPAQPPPGSGTAGDPSPGTIAPGRSNTLPTRPPGFEGKVELRLSGAYFENAGPSLDVMNAMHQGSSSYRPGDVVALDPNTPGRMLVLERPLVGPEHVEDVQDRPPFVRILLDAQGAAALCAATGVKSKELVILSDGLVRGALRADERICDGIVSVPLDGLVSDAESTLDARRSAAVGVWKVEDQPLAALAELTADDEASISSVGRFLTTRFADPAQRLRGIHDYVATRVQYDTASLVKGQRVAQDADTVFRTHKAVCAGYSNLMVALGKVSGIEVVYLSGKVRDEGGDIAGSGHAWNAARLGEQWVLIDATWDAGGVSGDSFTPSFSTEYFATPPSTFVITHLPAVAGWQLLATPISRGEFTRLPKLNPAFFAAGMSLRTPDRSQVDVVDAVDLTIANPLEHALGVEARGQRDNIRASCEVEGSRELRVRCSFPKPGAYNVLLFAGPPGSGSLEHVGGIQVNAG